MAYQWMESAGVVSPMRCSDDLDAGIDASVWIASRVIAQILVRFAGSPSLCPMRMSIIGVSKRQWCRTQVAV